MEGRRRGGGGGEGVGCSIVVIAVDEAAVGRKSKKSSVKGGIMGGDKLEDVEGIGYVDDELVAKVEG